MTRSTVRLTLLGVALAAWGGVRAGDERLHVAPAPPGTPPSESSSFFHSFLAPRMSARLGGARAAVATEFANPNANVWTRSTGDTEDRVRRGAIHATKSALKKYALERLNLTGWSLPLGSGQPRGVAAFRTESGGPRLRFGFSHRSPRAEVLLPVDRGNVSVSADLFGRLGASFGTPGGGVRVGAYLDPKERTATAGLTVSF